ncbi:MAG: glycosyltransferase family 4 protein [Patescibacteria group bacterium]
MKPTLLITKFFPPEKGGIQSYLYNLVLELPKDKIYVITHWSPDESQRLSPAFAGTPKFPFKIYRVSFQSPLRYLHLTTFDLFFKARKIIKKHKIEKVLCGHLAIAGPIAYLIKKQYNIPYIIFTYGLDIFSVKNLSSQKQKIFKKILQEAEKIVVIMDLMSEYLIREFQIVPEKIIKISPGVDSEFFKPGIADFSLRHWRELKLANPGAKIILTCGRLVERKNHISVIRALPKIIKLISNVLYLIVGQGPEEKNLKNEVNHLNLQNYVKFLDEVPQEDLPRLYNLADVFVMPARDIPEQGDIEGFGVVFLEAAASGLPCIAGATSGQAEAIEDKKTGFLVNPENVNEIADTILKLLKNPQLAKQLGQAGRVRVVEKFNWKKQAEKLKKILL